VVECDLAKVEVAGSNPVSRSRFQGCGKLFSSPPRRRRLITASFFAVFVILFLAGPQLGCLDADLDGVTEVSVIGATSVRTFKDNDSAGPTAARTPQFPLTSQAHLTVRPHQVAATRSPWLWLAEEASLSLRC
jgi:hypothetical protein